MLTVKEQHAALTRRIQGHFNYFGVNGNLESLRKVRLAAASAGLFAGTAAVVLVGISMAMGRRR